MRSDAGAVVLFVDGECFDCTGATARIALALCAHEQLSVDAEQRLSDGVMSLIAKLFNQGSLMFEGTV
jgi:50S ribosomal protein L16 3-hydroxylase